MTRRIPSKPRVSSPRSSRAWGRRACTRGRSRTIRAPRQKVFDAFVKPELIRKWFGPRGFTVVDAALDPRAGGRYRLTMKPRTGESHTVGGEYHDQLVRTPDGWRITNRLEKSIWTDGAVPQAPG